MPGVVVAATSALKEEDAAMEEVSVVVIAIPSPLGGLPFGDSSSISDTPMAPLLASAIISASESGATASDACGFSSDDAPIIAHLASAAIPPMIAICASISAVG